MKTALSFLYRSRWLLLNSCYLCLQTHGSLNTQLDHIFESLSKVEEHSVQTRLLRGTLAGLSGKRDLTPPDSWNFLRGNLIRSPNPEVSKLAGQLAQIFGDSSISEDSLKLVLNKEATLEDRKEALSSLVAMRFQKLPQNLKYLLDTELQIDAIRAYAFFDFPDAPEELIAEYVWFDAAAKRATIDTLASRFFYAQALLDALKAKKIAKVEIPVYTARTLQKILGKSFEKTYGKVSEVGEGKDRMISKYRERILKADFSKANVSKGRIVYQQACGACHVMYGEGGKIGPELTGSNRANLDYFLLNVLAPSYDVPEGYRMVTVTAKDGQVLIGSVVEEDTNKLVLNMVGQRTIVAKADIQSRMASMISMMPEGLLNPLQDQQIIDLVAYMRTEEQVPLP